MIPHSEGLCGNWKVRPQPHLALPVSALYSVVVASMSFTEYKDGDVKFLHKDNTSWQDPIPVLENLPIMDKSQ
jgi:hypothetical protein